MSIVVKNISNDTIDVAINSWGDGSSEFYPIANDAKESWDRSDNRGFVMVITKGGENRKHGTYWYVKAGAEIIVKTKSDVVGAFQSLNSPF